MKHWFSDVSAFRRDPLGFLLARGDAATEGLEPLALGRKPVLLVTDPDLVKPLLKANEGTVNKGRLMQKLRPVLGNSTLLMNGAEGRRRRSVLHAQLARGNVERFVPQIAAEIRMMGAQLARRGSFNPREFTAPFALRVVCLTVFGKQVMSAADERALVAAVNSIEDEVADGMVRMLPPTPWQWYAQRRRLGFAKLTMAFLVDKLRSKALESGALKALEALDISDDDLQHEILTLLLAGHHTTGSAAAWLFHHLASESGLMTEIAAEADAITDVNGEITAEGLKHADKSLALVREVLRLYPSTWWFTREVRLPFRLGGYELKRGSTLIVCPWQLHRSARHWDNPHAFDMERNYNGRAYLPFGAGPRACVGMGLAMLELQLLALETAAAYEFGGVSPSPAPWPKPSVTLIPPDMSVEIRLRQTRDVQRTAA